MGGRHGLGQEMDGRVGQRGCACRAGVGERPAPPGTLVGAAAPGHHEVDARLLGEGEDGRGGDRAVAQDVEARRRSGASRRRAGWRAGRCSAPRGTPSLAAPAASRTSFREHVAVARPGGAGSCSGGGTSAMTSARGTVRSTKVSVRSPGAWAPPAPTTIADAAAAATRPAPTRVGMRRMVLLLWLSGLACRGPPGRSPRGSAPVVAGPLSPGAERPLTPSTSRARAR